MGSEVGMGELQKLEKSGSEKWSEVHKLLHFKSTEQIHGKSPVFLACLMKGGLATVNT